MTFRARLRKIWRSQSPLDNRVTRKGKSLSLDNFARQHDLNQASVWQASRQDFLEDRVYVRQTSGDTKESQIRGLSLPLFFSRFQLRDESFPIQLKHHWRAAGLLVVVAAGCAGPSRRICWPMAEDWGWQRVGRGFARARNDSDAVRIGCAGRFGEPSGREL